jgi:hypothetical protein
VNQRHNKPWYSMTVGSVAPAAFFEEPANAKSTRRENMSVTVFVTHSSLTDMNAEVKLSSELSVAGVKKKLESHCGTAPQHQQLTLLDSAGKVIATRPWASQPHRRPSRTPTYSPSPPPPLATLSNKVVASLDDDDATLGASATTDGLTLHVTDLDPDSVAAALAATSVADVPKVELSADAAAARKAEFAKFKAITLAVTLALARALALALTLTLTLALAP